MIHLFLPFTTHNFEHPVINSSHEAPSLKQNVSAKYRHKPVQGKGATFYSGITGSSQFYKYRFEVPLGKSKIELEATRLLTTAFTRKYRDNNDVNVRCSFNRPGTLCYSGHVGSGESPAMYADNIYSLNLWTENGKIRQFKIQDSIKLSSLSELTRIAQQRLRAAHLSTRVDVTEFDDVQWIITEEGFKVFFDPDHARGRWISATIPWTEVEPSLRQDKPLYRSLKGGTMGAQKGIPESKIDSPRFNRLLTYKLSKTTRELADNGWEKADLWKGFDSKKDTFVGGGKNVAILIHGMSNDIKPMSHLGAYLFNIRNDDKSYVYTDILGFEYNWTDPIKKNGDHLARVISELRSRHPSIKIDLFGHSMGGLVARWSVEQSHGLKRNIGGYAGIDRIFTFGTPHLGVPAGCLQYPFGVVGKKLSLHGLVDLCRESPFLKSLNSSVDVKSKVSLLVAFAGNSTDYFVSNDVNKFYATYSPIDRPNDGIVSVHSAQPGLLDSKALLVRRDPSLVLPISHTNISGKYALGQSGVAFNLSPVIDLHVKRPVAFGRDWIYWPEGGKWYKAVHVSQGISWQDARKIAKSEGGDLVSINTAEENSFVFKIVDQSSFWFDYGGDMQFGPWIGLFQGSLSIEPNKGWMWVDGTTASFTNWHAKEPNDLTPNENVGAFMSHIGQRGSSWNDCNDYSMHRGLVIERNSPPTPDL